MRALIRRRSADGSVTEEAVDVPVFSIGRGTQNTVELAGHMVALEHAHLTLEGSGRYRLVSDSIAGVEVRGVSGVRSCELLPGDTLRISGHELTIDKPSGYHDLVILVTAREQDQHQAGREAILDLRSTGLGARKWAVAGVVIVLAFGLIIPLAARFVPAPAPAAVTLVSNAMWSTGPISFAHSHLADDCQGCHRNLFQPVSDAVCTDCHAAVGLHSEASSDGGPAEMIADCTGCHREHRGPHGLVADTQRLCSECHANPDRFAALSQVLPLHDFLNGHPEFTPTVTHRLDGGARGDAHLTLVEGLIDVTDLKFSHQYHLREEGVFGPAGAQRMVCQDCHVPDSGHVGMGLPRFRDHCASCHALDMAIGGRQARLPHGETEIAIQLLEMTASQPTTRPVQRAATDLRRRSGARAERRTEVEGGDSLDGVFDRQPCMKCHDMPPGDDGRPRVRPPRLKSEWFTGAHFSHAPHKSIDCADCHSARTSSDSEDLLLPSIKACRGCHTREGAGHGIPTPCGDCHRFHRVPRAGDTG